MSAYRIGWTTNRKWWHPHRPWQDGAEGVRFARRGFTATAAARKVRRDAAALPARTPHQAWRWWRKQTLAPFLCGVLGHAPHRLLVGPRPRHHAPSDWCKRCLTDLGVQP